MYDTAPSARQCRRLLCLLLAVGGLSSCAMLPSKPLPRTQAPIVQAGQWQAADGKSLPWQQWPEKAPRHPRAIIIAVHGLSGAALDFWPLGEAVKTDGDLLLCGLQLRGQGNDPVKAAHGDIATSQQWIDDLKEFDAAIRLQHPHIPIFWWGESLGSLICLHTLVQLPAERQPAGLIMASPPVQLREKLPAWKYALVKTLMVAVPGLKLTVAQLGGAAVGQMRTTSRATHDQQMAITPHHVPAFSLRLLGQVESLIKASPAAAAQLQRPLLVLYTAHDPLVSPQGVEAWFDQVATPDKRRLFYPKSFHLVLHDTEAPRALRSALDWIEHRALPEKARREN
jgi:acylglycerol lipase